MVPDFAGYGARPKPAQMDARPPGKEKSDHRERDHSPSDRCVDLPHEQHYRKTSEEQDGSANGQKSINSLAPEAKPLYCPLTPPRCGKPGNYPEKPYKPNSGFRSHDSR